MNKYFYAEERLSSPVILADPVTGRKTETTEYRWKFHAFFNENAREVFVAMNAENARAVKTAQVPQAARRKAIARLKKEYAKAAEQALQNIAERTDWQRVGEIMTDSIQQVQEVCDE